MMIKILNFNISFHMLLCLNSVVNDNTQHIDNQSDFTKLFFSICRYFNIFQELVSLDFRKTESENKITKQSLEHQQTPKIFC